MTASSEPTPTITPQAIAILIAIGASVVIVFIAIVVRYGNGEPPPSSSTTTTQATTTTTTEPPDDVLDSLANPAGMASVDEWGALTAQEVEDSAGGQYGAFHNPQWTEPIVRTDNGPHSQGQFRLLCAVSHFSYNDPILFPDQPGASHLHMYFGNETVEADTTAESQLEAGGGTCQSGPLNRSGYWMPALLSGPNGPERQVVIPKTITLYYKSHRPDEVNLFPVGTQLLAGNVGSDGSALPSFPQGRAHLSWGCYDRSRGLAVDLRSTIPGTNGTSPCSDGWDIQATLQFPQCLAVDTDGEPVLTSDDHQSHTIRLGSSSQWGPQTRACPASHPYRVPQISYLVRWANPQGDGETLWRLSSDVGADDTFVEHPGGSLHGDWLGGWHEGSQQAWLDGCFLNEPRNCSQGQTGQNGTGLRFRPIEGNLIQAQIYRGPALLPCPNCKGEQQ